jgi:hypothetical protein
LGDIVNLRRARKQKGRELKQAEADANRLRFGQTMGEKRRAESERVLADAKLDAHRLNVPDAE